MEENNPEQCNAKTKQGYPCKNIPEEGRTRCWKHGGAPGSGAPYGNKNAIKHGFYSKESKTAREEIDQIINVLEGLKSEINS